MTDSFWNGGSSAYVRGLKREYEETLTALDEKLQHCRDKAETLEIERQIDAIKTELTDKLRGVDSMIF